MKEKEFKAMKEKWHFLQENFTIYGNYGSNSK